MSASKPGALCYQLPDGTWDDKELHEELLGESLDIDPAIRAFIERNPLTSRSTRDEYNPNQPRVPKGSGDPSGQWAGRLEEPTAGSLARERARAMREEEAGRPEYERRLAESLERERKRTAHYFEARRPGESDKLFAKRVIDKRDPPDRLPQDFEANFNMKPDTQVVPIDRIVSSKSAEETITSAPNAAKRMAAAANGELSKRDPISVRPLGRDTYKVLDGNSTYAAARHYGWTHIPVQVILKDHATFDGQQDMDFILQFMRDNDVPITRDAYIALNWPDADEVQWDAEYEAELPKFLQDWSLFSAKDGVLHYKPTLDYNPNPTRHPEGTEQRGPSGERLGGKFAPKEGGGSSRTIAGEDPKILARPIDIETVPEFDEDELSADMAYPKKGEPKGTYVQPLPEGISLLDTHKAQRVDELSFKESLDEYSWRTGKATSIYAPKNTVEPGTELMKSMSSAQRKLNDDKEYGGDPRRIMDLIRGTVAYDTVAQARAGALQYIKENGFEKDGGSIVRVKDRIKTPVDGGYRDILVNVRTKSGFIAEVQFNSDRMLNEKMNGRGHKLYDVARNMKPPFNESEHEAFDIRRARNFQESEELYYDAYKGDENGNDRWGTRRTRR